MSTISRTVRRAIAVTTVLMLPWSAAHADDVAAWGKDREMRFATVHAAHPPQDATIARIKATTAVLVAAAPTIAGPGAAPIVWRTETTPVVVFDVPVAPCMVVIPAGEFTMGSPASEPGRAAVDQSQHRVRFDHALAVSMFPVTYGEYAWFTAATKRVARSCTAIGGEAAVPAGRNWQNPGFSQTARSPATCIAYEDATAYAAWLSQTIGQRYRLLTEAEYEYANRGGTATAYWWGDEAAAGCPLVNGFDQDAQPTRPSVVAAACHDGHVFTMPLDTSKANGFGLFDTTGNVASWAADCWTDRGDSTSAARACRRRVVRGGSWASPPAELRAAARAGQAIDVVRTDNGFRVARDL